MQPEYATERPPQTPEDEAVTDVNFSYNPTELTRRSLLLSKQQDRIANFVQGLPTREEYDALVSEHAAMREKLNRLELLLDSFVRRAA